MRCTLACEVRLVEQPTYILRKHLEEGGLDVMVDTPHPDTNAYTSELLAEEEIVLAVPDIRLTCVGVENALGLTQKQLGITFVPEFFSAVPQFAHGVRFFHVRGIRPCRQICLVYSRSSYQSLHLQSLLGLFRELVPPIYQIAMGLPSSIP